MQIEFEDWDIGITEIESHYMSFWVAEIAARTSDGEKYYTDSGQPNRQTTTLIDAQVFLSGSIKWDGCADLQFPNNCYHFCGKEDAESFGRLLQKLYQLAGVLIINYEGE